MKPRSSAISFVWACAFAALAAAPSGQLAAQSRPANMVYDTLLYSGMHYRMIGPYRGGRVTAVAGIAGQPYTYYMGSTGGGVWKTTDAGGTWENISDGYFDVSSIGAIDVADSDPNVVYVGTGSACIRGNVSTGRGVYKSTDAGVTWTFVGLEDAGQIGKVIVHPTNPDLVYVAALGHPFGTNAMRGVFRSKDGGKTWDKVLFVSDSTGFVDLSMDPTNPRVIYAASWRAQRKPWTIISGSREGGIYKTTDGGDTWTRLEGGLPTGLFGKQAVAVSPANPNRVWALIEAPGKDGGLYRSEDAGKTWRHINGSHDLTQRAWYYIHLHADPKDENTVYVLNTSFYKSVDAGKTFERIRLPHGDVHGLWLNPTNPDFMIASDDGGAQVTLDGGASWSTMLNQPTAEIYSVTVDNQFPYRVYGPQQDNSTITVPAWTGGGITPKQFWYSVAGCETGPVAMDPDHPDIIYSGCYGGVIDKWNEKTGQTQNMNVYPQLQLGAAPKDLKYRFQWNSPIALDPRNGAIYHGAQYVLRSTDGGINWERISPDLTTNTPAHQESAGEPITHDNTGIEVYNTVFTIALSPQSPDEIWAGTDDGRVHITRDGGASWTEITPKNLPRLGTVQSIDVSTHQPGRAYIAVHKYRLDDWHPYIFRTDDYGKSWTLLTDGKNGIPANSPVRVVREDPNRDGLLYAGTEFGLFVSFDDGAHWQSLQLNLPVTPVMDLKIHEKDLAVATQGRSFWILDDLTPLYQIDDQLAGASAHLYQPRDAYRTDIGRFFAPATPDYPPEGAMIDYYFAKKPEGEVKLEVLDSDGNVVRTFTSDSAKARKAREPTLPADVGMTRFAWNLRYPSVDVVRGAVLWGRTSGPKAVPGAYSVRLTHGDFTQTQSFNVLKDPRLTGVTVADLKDQFDLMVRIRDEMDDIYDAIRSIRAVRAQVKSVAANAKKGGVGGDVGAQADSLTAHLTAIEEKLMQTKSQSGQDPINFPPQLDNQFAAVYGYVGGADAKPNPGARTRLADIEKDWQGLKSSLDGVLQTELPAFNNALKQQGVPAIIMPKSDSGDGMR